MHASMLVMLDARRKQLMYVAIETNWCLLSGPVLGGLTRCGIMHMAGAGPGAMLNGGRAAEHGCSRASTSRCPASSRPPTRITRRGGLQAVLIHEASLAECILQPSPEPRLLCPASHVCIVMLLQRHCSHGLQASPVPLSMHWPRFLVCDGLSLAACGASKRLPVQSLLACCGALACKVVMRTAFELCGQLSANAEACAGGEGGEEAGGGGRARVHERAAGRAVPRAGHGGRALSLWRCGCILHQASW